MTKPLIILVERHHGRDHDSYFDSLQRHFVLVPVTSGKQALAHVIPDAVVLNALSLRSPGDRIARQLKTGLPSVPLIHLHPLCKTDSPADTVLCPPFTARKLISTIKRLLPAPDEIEQADSLLICGMITMNLTRRLLIAQGQETPLTPKLAALIEVFLRHPGETLERRWLMQHVWQTDYVEDTRTLDVHVRWFRRLIEPNPNKPCYLKTVRGVGYRLDLELSGVPIEADKELLPVLG